MLSYLRSHVVHPNLLVGALAAWIVCIVTTALHYTGTYPGNDVDWISWLAAVALFCGAFLRPTFSISSPSRRALLRSELWIALLVLLMYLPTHLWNISSAPWNTNGLFDDAAWDIYFSKIHVFNGPFQAAFYDALIPGSREVVFHYYFTTFFKVFGYNVAVFTSSLLVLGFVTVLFTTLIVDRLFRNPWVTATTAVVVNFFPFIYLHIYVGHRDSMPVPLMMVSLYFLYSGFIERSFFRIAASAFFAALCLDSAIVGKQYILGLAVAAVLIPLVDRRWRSVEARALGLMWLVAFIISATPLVAYVAFNGEAYFYREGGLLSAFLEKYAQLGIQGIAPYFSQLAEMFLAQNTFLRNWLPGFPLIPLAYYPLLAIGLVIAILGKRLELAFLSVIPLGSALLAGSYDFRVLLAAPIWVICIAFALDLATRVHIAVRGRRPVPLWAAPALGLVLLGLLPGAKYVWDVSQDPNSEYLLIHRDVAAARLIQDIVAGVPNPTSAMRSDEFDPIVDSATLANDSFVCPATAFGVMHLYLEDFDDRRILSFCGQINEALQDPAKIISLNVAAIEAYRPTTRGLQLIWEQHPKAASAVEKFRRYEALGSGRTYPASVDGQSFSVYVLTIASDNVGEFQRQVAADAASGLL
jgi:hypothetical protein